MTQLYNINWVYNDKRKGEVEFNNRKFEFRLKSAFPKNITKEYLLVEFLNNLDRLAEDSTQLLDKLKKNILNYNSDLLMKVTQQYGIGETKQTL